MMSFCVFSELCRYQKLQNRDTSENDLSGSSTTNVHAKYVILEEIDDQDAGI